MRDAPGLLDGLDRGERRVRALEPGNVSLDHRRRDALAGSLSTLEDVVTQAVPVDRELPDVRVVRVGPWHEVEQVERTARVLGEIRGDGRDDAARRTSHDEDGILRELHARQTVRSGPFGEPDGPPQSIVVADLDRAGIGESLSDQQGRDFVGLTVEREIDRLHERIRTLALVALRKAGHGAAERGRRAGSIVAVFATEPCAGNEEGRRSVDGLVERPHRRGEQLHADAKRLAPGS